MMKGLIKKDLYTLKNYLSMFCVQAAALCVMAVALKGMGVYVMGVMVMVSATAVIGTFSYDESAKWDRYAVALPVSRRQIVLSKYLITLAVMAATALLAAGMGAVAGALQGVAGGTVLALAAVLAVACLNLLSLAVSLPVAFRLGAEKARIIVNVVYMGVYVIGFLVLFLLRGRSLVMPGLTGLWVVAALAGAGLLCVAAFVASYFLSVRFYAKREF